MILVDTSVWVDHLRHGSPALERLLDDGLVLGHPWVVAELALGQLTHRSAIIRLLKGLPQAAVATEGEVLHLIERHRLYGMGIGCVDVHLLAAARLTHGAQLWTADRRLAVAASRLGCRADPQG